MTGRPAAGIALFTRPCQTGCMADTGFQETQLYPPVKALLEGQGYEVKGEVGAADVVAVNEDGDTVIVELKKGFSLSLFHQAVERQRITDAVYVAVPRGAGRAFAVSLRKNKGLCRRLGLGLITIRMRDGCAEILLDPAPYQPRMMKTRRSRLLGEFARLVGDPNEGGSTRTRLMTAYRQDAIRCLTVLHEQGPCKAALVAERAGVEKARRLMADNHYGWFERVETGIYALSPKGKRAVTEYDVERSALMPCEASTDTAVPERPTAA